MLMKLNIPIVRINCLADLVRFRECNLVRELIKDIVSIDSQVYISYLPTTLNIVSGHGDNFPGFSRFFLDV